MYYGCAIHPLSLHQKSRLMKGQGVSIKPASSGLTIHLDAQQMKKYERAKRLGKGMVLNMHPHQIGYHGGSVESMFRDTGAYLRPVADAGMSRAIREIEGRGFEDVMRDTGAYLRPVADAGMARAIREIEGRGKKGRGAFEDKLRKKLEGVHLYNKQGELVTEKKGSGRKRGKGFFEDLGRAFDPQQNGVADVFNEDLGKQIASNLIHQGIPIAGSTIGGLAGTAVTGGPIGGFAGAYGGQEAGRAIADEIGRKTGYGMKRRGKGLMSDAFSMAKSQGKKMAKSALAKAKVKAKELVNQYLDLGEKKAEEMIGDGAMGGYKKKFGGRMRGKALLVA